MIITMDKEIIVICERCKEPLTYTTIGENKISTFCYPCHNDAFEEGVLITTEQFRRYQ